MAGSNNGAGNSGDDQQDPKDAKVKTEKFVVYKGTSDVREIDKASFASVGVEAEEKLVWDAKNGHRIKVADLPKGVVDYLESNKADDFAVEDIEV